MIVQEIQTPQINLVPAIPSYKFLAGTGTMHGLIYFKET